MVWDSCTLIQHLMESSLEGVTPYPTEVCLMEYPFIAALTLKTSRISVGYQTSLCLLFISKTPYCIYRLTKAFQSKGPLFSGRNPLSLSTFRCLTYLPSITVERGFNFYSGPCLSPVILLKHNSGDLLIYKCNKVSLI